MGDVVVFVDSEGTGERFPARIIQMGKDVESGYDVDLLFLGENPYRSASELARQSTFPVLRTELEPHPEFKSLTDVENYLAET